MNEAIIAPEVVLIDRTGKNLGGMSREQAFFLAHEQGLDLVEVSGQATPPVIRILDFGKERYDREKRTRKQRAKQKSGEMKEIKLSFLMSEHDFQTRIRQAEKFIARGDQIKLGMRLVGRENAFAEQAKEKFIRFAEILKLKVPNITKQGNRLSAILTR
ncbi:translation initiation factor IF-3 [Candidatus Berkelbacteria bacterium]|nr:translation initiation factor IF-3 [Candidatus Berkelbacteria bacterium]